MLIDGRQKSSVMTLLSVVSGEDAIVVAVVVVAVIVDAHTDVDAKEEEKAPIGTISLCGPFDRRSSPKFCLFSRPQIP